MPTHVLKVSPDHNKVRLDVFLTEHLPDIPSRSFVKKLIDGGHVRINESLVKAHHKVSDGEEIHIDIPKNFLSPQYIEPENIPLDIFYEDESLFIINKPVGMLVHPTTTRATGTLVNALLYHSVNLSNVNSDIRPGIVHRLDQETSGLIIVAKDNITHTKLAKQFQRHVVKKCYVALVEGLVEFDEGVINEPIGRHAHHHEKKAISYDTSGKESITRYKVLKRGKNVTLIALFPKTGRTHQLRVHMKHLGHVILGDDKYGKKSSFSRLALHAHSIGFMHPKDKKFVEFICQVPKEFMNKINEK